MPNSRNPTPFFPNHPYSKLISLNEKPSQKANTVIKTVDKHLTYISKHANLNEPETVKQFIAN